MQSKRINNENDFYMCIFHARPNARFLLSQTIWRLATKQAKSRFAPAEQNPKKWAEIRFWFQPPVVIFYSVYNKAYTLIKGIKKQQGEKI